MFPVAGVFGVVPVVAHDKVTAFRNCVRAKIPLHRFLCVDIFKRLIRTIYVDISVTDLYGLTGKADDPFDKKLAFIVGIPKNDDIKPRRSAIPRIRIYCINSLPAEDFLSLSCLCAICYLPLSVMLCSIITDFPEKTQQILVRRGEKSTTINNI